MGIALIHASQISPISLGNVQSQNGYYPMQLSNRPQQNYQQNNRGHRMGKEPEEEEVNVECEKGEGCRYEHQNGYSHSVSWAPSQKAPPVYSWNNAYGFS